MSAKGSEGLVSLVAAVKVGDVQRTFGKEFSIRAPALRDDVFVLDTMWRVTSRVQYPNSRRLAVFLERIADDEEGRSVVLPPLTQKQWDALEPRILEDGWKLL